VSNNLKSAVVRAHGHEPDLNPAYREFAEYYELAIWAASVCRPRDKAKVKKRGVLVVEKWILVRLRDRQFFGAG